MRLKQWQARGGQIDIIKARLAQEDVIAVGAGTIKLTFPDALERMLKESGYNVKK